MSRAKRPAAGTAARATRVSNRTPIPSAFVRRSTGTETQVATELFPREYLRSTGGLGIGRWHPRTLSGGRLHDGVDGSIAAPRALGAPVRPHAGERHGDLSPSGRHPGGGGVAVAADRASLRLSPATPDWSQELARLAGVHRWVVAGLALIFASGLLMMFAER